MNKKNILALLLLTTCNLQGAEGKARQDRLAFTEQIMRQIGPEGGTITLGENTFESLTNPHIGLNIVPPNHSISRRSYQDEIKGTIIAQIVTISWNNTDGRHEIIVYYSPDFEKAKSCLHMTTNEQKTARKYYSSEFRGQQVCQECKNALSFLPQK